jgi:hypothetical protein
LPGPKKLISISGLTQGLRRHCTHPGLLKTLQASREGGKTLQASVECNFGQAGLLIKARP